MKHGQYLDSFVSFKRLKSKEVSIGNVVIGGSNPIRIQSMTNTDTLNTYKTIEQIKQLQDVGCEIVRITTPSVKSVESLSIIKNELIKENIRIPLVADVHFSPIIALKAAEIVEKVRINPGNYSDNKKFATNVYSDEENEISLLNIEEKLVKLIDVCKKNETTIRIGVNHGSLSDRIVNRYGDNPEGMVASAIEFLTIFEKYDFKSLVISMKSSNTTVMVRAYRLLVEKMKERNDIYPLHLGVTEAGLGEEGRIKSCVGIGSLLSDGIGDTIRVSLTEAPEKEIPVAQKLLDYFSKLKLSKESLSFAEPNIDFYRFSRRKTQVVHNFGGKSVPKVIVKPESHINTEEDLQEWGLIKHIKTDKWESKEFAPDGIFLKHLLSFEEPFSTKLIYEQDIYKEAKGLRHYLVFSSLKEYQESLEKERFLRKKLKELPIFVKVNYQELNVIIENNFSSNICFVFLGENNHIGFEFRNFIFHLNKHNKLNPIFINLPTYLHKNVEEETKQINIASYLGSTLVDGLVDGVWAEDVNLEELFIIFSTLQASRQRIFKPEYISCPSCGRTLFDLEEVTNKIKAKTSHLKGIKIGIMGCIVNGPGEMADADFGYVGSGPGKITLYKGKEVVKRGIDSKICSRFFNKN